MTKSHKHKFVNVAYQAVLGDDSSPYRQKHVEHRYMRDPMCLVYYCCECGAREPLEYGPLKKMKELAERISKDVSPTKLPSVRDPLNLSDMRVN